jgi:5-methylcytosine-specific restriction protein B
MYFGATDGEKAVSIHLFGIKFAEQLSGASLREIAVRAGVDESYATEIRKGMNLAKYVSVKQ